MSELGKAVKELDIVFGRYIKQRDAPDGFFCCISCGKTFPLSKGECGHYIGRTNMGTRFNPDNCFCECWKCNNDTPDHLEGFRRNMVERIGEDRVKAVEALKHVNTKLSTREIKELTKFYRKKLNK